LQVSRLVFHDVEAKERELMLWIMPRGLITVVLALQVVAARSEVSFLSALAFAVILVTNVMVVVGSLRASRAAVANSATATVSATPEINEDQPGKPSVVAPVASRRWILDATMLILLGLGACILWYGNQPMERRPRSLQHWVQLHLRRSH
jgi:NhaP-type Na+/H+ and K+/H+ antiporter